MRIFHNKEDLLKRISILALSILVLIFVYLFQRLNYYQLVFGEIFYHPYLVFVFNKFVRLTINDTACLMIIYALFYDKAYMKVGVIVQVFEMFLVLPIYFAIKLTLEGDSEISSPLLSQIHRLIVNPMLMLLLIIGFYIKDENKK